MARRTASITLSAAFLFAAAGSFPGCALGQSSQGGGVVSSTPDVAKDTGGGGGEDDNNDRSDNSNGTYSTQYDGTMLTLTSDATGELLIEQRARDFAKARVDGALAPEIDVEITAQGYTIHYSFTNNTSSAKPLPDLRVGPIFLNDNVTYQDTRRSCEDVRTSAATHKTPGHNYPINMYAPIWIVRNADHVTGVSLEYPIMDYKHDTRFYLKYHSGTGGWLVDIRLSTESESLVNSASVPPGQTWNYTLNVRLDGRSEEWVRTLLPYRDFFRETYGGVQYTRETNPINAVGLSLGVALSDDNPYGFSREDLRPDINGFGPFIDYTLDRKGWPEHMIITPSGILQRNRHLNYPFRFTSEWLATDNFQTALDPDIGYPRIVDAGRKLGFWWGRAAQVSYAWDDGVGEQLDPNYSRHTTEAFKELDLAIQAGATTIGLDTFGYRAIPTWDASPWLDAMRQRYPDVKFVLEPMPADIMHRQAAGWLRGFNDGQPVDDLDELNFIKGPHILADFLLPGHETWAAWRYKGHRKYLGITPTQQMVTQDVERFAQWGYRPMLYTEFDLRTDGRAMESWTYTIPVDLQIPPDDGSNNDPAADMGDGDEDNQGNNGAGRGIRATSNGASKSGAPSRRVSSKSGSSSKPDVVGVSGAEAHEALVRARKHLKPVKPRKSDSDK